MCAHLLPKTLNLVILRCCFADDGKEMYKPYITHVQSDCFCSLNLLLCGVLVAVAVAIICLSSLFSKTETVNQLIITKLAFVIISEYFLDN